MPEDPLAIPMASRPPMLKNPMVKSRAKRTRAARTMVDVNLAQLHPDRWLKKDNEIDNNVMYF